MAMRCGSGGTSMWPVCREQGIAAITYRRVSKTDLSKVAEREFLRVCGGLSVPRKVSLHRLAYEMKPGDVIYVKEGHKIIGKGTIKGGKARPYIFDSHTRIIDENGTLWSHQVPVHWDDTWLPIEIMVGKSQRYAIEPIDLVDVARLTRKRVAVGTNSLSTYIARVCWNTKNWIQPSGDASESEADGTYASENGFGHEEWLFNFQWMIDGWKHGFLQPINRSIQKLKGSNINLRLFTITADRNRQYIGEINRCTVLNDAQASDAVRIYKKSGWLSQMRRQIHAVSGDTSALQCSPLELFNIRFKPEDATLYAPPIPVKNNDYVNRLNRYSLVSLTGRRASVEKQWRGRVGSTKDKPTGKQKRTGRGDTLVDLVHNELQNELASLLKTKYGRKAVVVEENFVDICLKVKRRVVFIEVKSDPRAVQAVRQAIGQLLQYYFIAKTNGGPPTELIVAAPGTANAEKQFVDHLRTKWKLPIRYVCFRSGMKESEIDI
ncbi:MAG: hypothetical protein H8K03_01590 [Nitrospira sp.]